jgi:hypothetical protein
VARDLRRRMLREAPPVIELNVESVDPVVAMDRGPH